MAWSTNAEPAEIEVRKIGTSVLESIARRGNKPFNLWIFDSPKNGARLRISGDLCFMLCVLLEGDTSVKRYKVDSGPYLTVVDGEPINISPDIEVERYDGPAEWWELVSSQLTKRRKKPESGVMALAAASVGTVHVRRSADDMNGKAVAFDNWLLLSAAINRARHYGGHYEARILRRFLDLDRKVTVGKLLQQEGIDQALMIAQIAQFLHAGRACCDLDSRLFCGDTLLRAR
jgi:hypothetical protein